MSNQRGSKYEILSTYCGGTYREEESRQIKDDCGLWIDDHRHVAAKFMSDYQHRFKSVHQGDRSLPYLGLSNIITPKDNEQLIRLPDL